MRYLLSVVVAVGMVSVRADAHPSLVHASMKGRAEIRQTWDVDGGYTVRKNVDYDQIDHNVDVHQRQYGPRKELRIYEHTLIGDWLSFDDIVKILETVLDHPAPIQEGSHITYDFSGNFEVSEGSTRFRDIEVIVSIDGEVVFETSSETYGSQSTFPGNLEHFSHSYLRRSFLSKPNYQDSFHSNPTAYPSSEEE